MRDLVQQSSGVALLQTGQCQLGTMRASSPWQTELRSSRTERQHPGGRALIDQQTEPFQCRRVDPMQVFHDQEERLLGGQAQEEREERLQGALLLLLRGP